MAASAQAVACRMAAMLPGAAVGVGTSTARLCVIGRGIAPGVDGFGLGRGFENLGAHDQSFDGDTLDVSFGTWVRRARRRADMA
jgi:hypothetical protein